MINNAFTQKIAVRIGTFLAILLTFMATIFPNDRNLMVYRQGQENSEAKYAPIIIESFETKDVAKLKSVMCANIQNNVPGLDRKIQEMFGSVEGEIVSSSWETGASASYSSRKGTINQTTLLIDLSTSVEKYRIAICWEAINNIKPDETKIRNIILKKWVPDEIYGTLTEEICRIEATEGVGEWHE